MNITGVEMKGAFLPGMPISPSQQDELSCLPPDGVSIDSLLPRRCPTAPTGSPLLFTLAEVAHCASTASSFICVFRCTELQAGETLQQHVQKYNSSTCTTGPFLQTSLQFMSEPMLQCFGFKDLHAAAKWSSRAWRSNSRFMLEWEAHVKNTRLGLLHPMVVHAVRFAPGASSLMIGISFPAIIEAPVKVESSSEQEPRRRWWSMVQQVMACPADDPLPSVWGLRNLLAMRSMPACLTIVDPVSGAPLWQNAASMAAFGCHAWHNLLNTAEPACKGSAGSSPMDFLDMLFNSRKEELQQVHDQVAVGQCFRARLEVVHWQLRQWMGLEAKQRCFHEVHITAVRAPHVLGNVYVVAQVDVTDAVLAEQQVAALQRQQEALLQQILPQQVITKLLERHTAKAGEQHDTAQEQLAVPDGVTLPAAAGPAASSLDMDAGKESFVSVTGHLISISPAKPSPAKSAGPPCDTLAAPCQQAPPPASPGGLPQLSGRDVMDLATMHQEVSILFAHIQGFTTMSQRMDPGQTMLLLDHLYSLFDDLLEHHDCYKVETIGDCYMVCAGLFDRSGDTHSCQQGAPSISEAALGADPDQDNRGPHVGSPAPRQLHSPKRRHLHNGGALGGHDPDHAHKLLRFSIAMLRAAQSVTDPWGDPVQMRCGLHCGPVMSGVIGTRMPRFCLFGDTVNTASRMASTGKADVIHVSQAFMSHLPHEAWCETPGVDVKGKGWMQTAFLDPRGRAAAAL